MVNKLTRRLIGILAMMVLMMTTSLSVQATCYFAGSATNWQTGREAMNDDDGDGIWTYSKAFAEGETFKIMVDDTWYGMPASGTYWLTADKLNTGVEMQMQEGNENLEVKVAGTYTILFDSNSKKLRMGAEAPVTVKVGIQNGNVSVDKATAIPGETVTITATPANGFYIEAGNITVEKTINGGSAQAPGLKAEGPGVGGYVTPIVAGEEANTFTFAMPESPYGAQVSAEFQARIPITIAMIQPNPIPDQDYTGEQVKPVITVKDGETTLVEGTDYTLEYGANVEDEGTIIVTGIGKYTGTVTLTFTIKQGIFYVNIDENITHGSVTANPSSGEEDTLITITLTAELGYVPESLTIDGQTVDVNALLEIAPLQTGERQYRVDPSFPMPNHNIFVTATFKLADYAINITQGANGTVASDHETAHYGESVTITATPIGDYKLETLVVDGADVIDLVNNNTYTFTMPNHNVEVSATFVALPVTYQINYGKQGNPWTETGSITMTKNAEGKWVTEGQVIPAGFEAVLIRKVEGQEDEILKALADGDYWITDANLVQNEPINMGTGQGFNNLYFPKAGNYTFTYNPVDKKMLVGGEYVYNINIAETENGTVTTDPVGPVAAETPVTINATPNTGYEVGTITVMNGETTVPVQNNVFEMPAADVTVTVTFVPKEFEITVNPSENGSVSIVGKELVQNKANANYNEEITLTVTPAEGYEVETLTYTVEGGEAVPIENNKFTMPAGNVTINATFKKATYTITVTNPSTEVTVDKTTAQMGDEVTITITPAAGYEVDAITVMAGETPVTVENNKFNMPAANVTVTVTFKKTDYTITVADIQNGTVVPSKTTANVGDVITLEVTPLGDYELATLTYTVEGGQPVTIENNQFTMPAGNVTINATFTALPVTYQINYGKQGNPWTETGSITMTKNAEGKWVTEGQVIPAGFEAVLIRKVEGQEDEILKALADGDYWITDANLVQNEPINMGTGQGFNNLYFPKAGNYTFTYNPVDKKMLVGGEYVYNINIAETENGTVTTDPAGPVAAETQVTINATPIDDNYRVESITVTYGEGENITTVPVTDNKFTMPAADVTVTVTFTKILTNNALTWNVPAEKGTVTATVDGETVENGGLVQEGKTVVVTVTPTAEWTVSKVSVNNEDLTLADGTYTFTMPAAPAEIVVEFTAVQHNITITPNEFVTVTTDPANTAAAGQEVTVTVTPNTPDDFVVGGVKVNGELVEPNEDGTYTFVMPAGDSGVTIDVVVEAKIQGVSFTADRNWATYIGAYNLVKPEGIKVYVVTGVASNAVVIEEVDYIPANVGVLLYGTAGEDLTTPLYTGETRTYTSKLVGSATEAQTITAGYVLYNNNFIRSEEGTVAAHRCYLPASEVAGAPRMLKIGYDGDVPTAIESIIAQGNVAGIKYVNINGMTSNEPFRGINIAVITFTDGTTCTMKVVK